MKPITNQQDFVEFARMVYDNPACVSLVEFETDIKRFSMFSRLVDKEDIPTRLLINSIIIIYNMFGSGARSLAEYKMSEKAFSLFESISIVLNKQIGELPKEHEWILKEIR